MGIEAGIKNTDTRTMALTDAKIRNAKSGAETAKLTDGSGLYLEVRPTGSKLWRYRYRIAGRENVFAAGQYVQAPVGETNEQTLARCNAGMLTLAEARTKRNEWRALVKRGIHPAHYRQGTPDGGVREERKHLRGGGARMDRKEEYGLDPILRSPSPAIPSSGCVPLRRCLAHPQRDGGAPA